MSDKLSQCGVLSVGINTPSETGFSELYDYLDALTVRMGSELSKVSAENQVKITEIIKTIEELKTGGSGDITREEFNTKITEIINRIDAIDPASAIITVCGGDYAIKDALEAIISAPYVASYEFSKAKTDGVSTDVTIQMGTGDSYVFNSTGRRVERTDAEGNGVGTYDIAYVGDFPYGSGEINFIADKTTVNNAVYTDLASNFWTWRGADYLQVNLLSNVSPVDQVDSGSNAPADTSGSDTSSAPTGPSEGL